MHTVSAVIVTNNRLKLLREVIAAVGQQIYPIKEVIVVNNASSDGTTEWLAQQSGLTVIDQENLGGSGGFFTGIHYGVANGSDWLWVMDDDTIPQPDTLEKLMSASVKVDLKIGFIGSKCIWTDGTPHLMNIPAITPSFNRTVPFNLYDEHRLLLIETCSFVSLLINTESVKQVGLPYKDFFIWGDDQEYTRRITKAGFLGLYSLDSVALHKTAVNYFPDFYHDTPANLWKHGYGFRNEFFMVKKNKGAIFFALWLPLKVAYTAAKLIRVRNTDRWKFIRVLLRSARRSVFFDPQVVHVNSPSPLQ